MIEGEFVDEGVDEGGEVGAGVLEGDGGEEAGVEKLVNKEEDLLGVPEVQGVLAGVGVGEGDGDHPAEVGGPEEGLKGLVLIAPLAADEDGVIFDLVGRSGGEVDGVVVGGDEDDVKLAVVAGGRGDAAGHASGAGRSEEIFYPGGAEAGGRAWDVGMGRGDQEIQWAGSELVGGSAPMKFQGGDHEEEALDDQFTVVDGDREGFSRRVEEVGVGVVKVPDVDLGARCGGAEVSGGVIGDRGIVAGEEDPQEGDGSEKGEKTHEGLDRGGDDRPGGVEIGER